MFLGWSRERSHQGVFLIVLGRSTLKYLIKALRSGLRVIFNPPKSKRLDIAERSMSFNVHCCQLQVPEQVKQEICNLEDSSHVWIIPFSEYIPYLLIAVDDGRTNGQSIDSAGDMVTCLDQRRAVGGRRTELPQLDYDCYIHNSDIRI